MVLEQLKNLGTAGANVANANPFVWRFFEITLT